MFVCLFVFYSCCLIIALRMFASSDIITSCELCKFNRSLAYDNICFKKIVEAKHNK